MSKLHTNKGYLYILIFILAITLFHFSIKIIYEDTPQIIKYISSQNETQILNPMYSDKTVENQNSIAYLFRNLVLRYIIYPAIITTFIIDRYNLSKYLNFVSWKTVLLSIIGAGSIITLISKPYLACITNAYFSVWRFSYLSLCQINFVNSTAAYYIYAIILWIILVVYSFKVLHKKMLVHHAIWLSLLIFLSVEEVWEYSPFIVFFPNLDMPLLQVFSLNLLRAVPSILLIYYGYRYGLGAKKYLFWLSFLVSVFVSVFYIVFPEYIFVSVFLRVVWVVTYLLFVYSLDVGGKNG